MHNEVGDCTEIFALIVIMNGRVLRDMVLFQLTLVARGYIFRASRRARNARRGKKTFGQTNQQPHFHATYEIKI